MATVRTLCPSCRRPVLLSPAQVLLVPGATPATGEYLFPCPACGRVAGGVAGPGHLLLLGAAGVPGAERWLDTSTTPLHPAEPSEVNRRDHS